MGLCPSLGLEAVKGSVLGEDDDLAFGVGGDEGGVELAVEVGFAMEDAALQGSAGPCVHEESPDGPESPVGEDEGPAELR